MKNVPRMDAISLEQSRKKNGLHFQTLRDKEVSRRPGAPLNPLLDVTRCETVIVTNCDYGLCL
jgi:hypothetical protein